MRVLTSDVTKLLIYLVACFALAALITPWVYNAGTFIGEVSEKGTGNAIIDYIGKHARKADYPDFFKRSLLISGILLLVPFLYSLRMRTEPPPLRESPWSIYLPKRAIARAGGQPLHNPRSGLLQLLVGFVLAGGLLFAMGYLLLSLGWFTLKDPVPWEKAWRKAAGPSISASLLEEIIFRGALLGIVLRTFRPSVAILLIAVLFSSLHFLQPPDDVAVFSTAAAAGAEGKIVINPESRWAGFALLKAIGLRFAHLDLVFFEFLTLAVIGLILGFARYATASLWLPIGLHSGWIFAYIFFGRIAIRTEGLDPSLSYVVGSDLKEGIIPLATLTLTAFLVFLFARIVGRPDPRYNGGEDAIEDEDKLPSGNLKQYAVVTRKGD